MPRPKQTQTPAGTRGEIVNLLRRSPRTVAELAAQLGVTYHAVRLHLLGLERDGMVRRSGTRGATRPAAVYETVPDVDASLSQAYIPYAAALTRVIGERLPARRVATIMRRVGRHLATFWPIPRGSLRDRVAAASALLEELGSPNDVEQSAGVLRIRGTGCLLASAVTDRGEVCKALEALLCDFLRADVRERCQRGERPRCCFEIRHPS